MATNETKQLLAHTLREMMTTTALDHITINALTTRAGVTRNTFYYHFEDIYSLLAWVYEQEIVTQMEKYAVIDRWDTAYAMLLDYIDDNRAFCLASFNSVGRDLLERLLATVAEQLVRRVVVGADPTLPKPLQEDICNFYGLAIVAQIIQWLMRGLVEDKTAMVKRADVMLTGALNNAVSNSRTMY
ncbi:TetR/AcrR family transcriptional regulator C-terminal domain-containing protein [Lacticaseibacillus daqingensis]|uniref:TetR/AcrR family transcriptional regulator C-terminal domain-containing protein n=1 Tax=Lacticaseibacillus daqingensis TaxID=2486014 RepID=UPI000F7722C2|nr:TetR/AcrR family transcriptional regulator C-terminal domain-containing protein [Lacticaseibacillus daqingensis]